MGLWPVVTGVVFGGGGGVWGSSGGGSGQAPGAGPRGAMEASASARVCSDSEGPGSDRLQLHA